MKQLLQQLRLFFKGNNRGQQRQTNPFADKLTDREFALIVAYVREHLLDGDLSDGKPATAEGPEPEEKESVPQSPSPIPGHKGNVPQGKGLPPAKPVPHGRKESDPGTASPTLVQLKRLTAFLCLNYRFRYNLMTAEVEFCPSGGDARYRTVTLREQNGIALAAQEAGIACWDRDVNRYIHSDRIPEFHPFTDFLENLPAWDGTDRVTPLARRVSDNPVWVSGFHRWMLAMVHQWNSRMHPEERANSVAPLLVSTRQGWGKSTFCRMLMPESMKRYFTESFDLNAPGACEKKLADFGLVCLDEFDKLSVGKMPLLKNLMQQSALNLRKSYSRTVTPLDRTASFIGTSNRRDLLTDRTGSRRFLCVEPEQPIDCTTPIEHTQLYAQLKAELQAGERHWFTAEEEELIEENNRPYYRSTPEEEVFHCCFRFADEGEPGAELLTAAEIFSVMQRKNRAALRGITAYAFSRLLPAMGKRVHTKYCNAYRVVRK